MKHFLLTLICLFLVSPAYAGGISWFGTWQDGLAEARRTGRPILLVAGAPQCHGVSGYW
jgi:hypothetical protein